MAHSFNSFQMNIFNEKTSYKGAWVK